LSRVTWTDFLKFLVERAFPEGVVDKGLEGSE